MATILTDVGENGVTDLIQGTSSTVLSASNAKIAWGTGAGTAAKGNTTLFIEASESRVAAVISQPASDTGRWVGTITADAGKTITNAGLFDAATSGSLYIKGDFTGIVLSTGDKIEFTVDLEIS